MLLIYKHPSLQVTPMKESTLIRLMNLLMFLGLALIGTALYLIIIKQLHVTMNIRGVQIIAAVVGAGLVLLLPSKLYLTLMLMKGSSTKPGLAGAKRSMQIKQPKSCTGDPSNPPEAVSSAMRKDKQICKSLDQETCR